MLAPSPSSGISSKALKLVSIVLVTLALGTSVCSAANKDEPTVRRIGNLNGDLAKKVLKKVRTAPFRMQHDSPILLEGRTLLKLSHAEKQELKATYQVGYAIVLLDPDMRHIRTLHGIVGAGMSYRSKDSGVMLAYSFRHENLVPAATLVTALTPSTLRTPSGDPDATALADDDMALARAADRTLTELSRKPKAIVPRPPGSTTDVVEWDQNPVQTHTFAVSSSQGVYNTLINVYALHRCLDNTDHYVVTAGADWTATNAQWQGATSETPNPSMYLDNSNDLVINWQSGRTYCSSGGFFADFDDVCRYINYPLSYGLAMIPRNEGTVIQTNAAPSATQGQQTTYTSGFSFTIGGTVNVSGQGPGGGISAGATWTNTTQTTVPPLIVDVSNTGNQGADWNFKYCTTGLEPDPGTNCTGHVQMVKDVCQAQLGDDSGTNPQQGQTAVGKFSNAVQSVHWQANPDTRTGSTFDIEVDFVARIGSTIAHLGNGLNQGPDPIAGCNPSGCACVSTTEVTPVSRSITFEVTLPSTACK